MNTLLLSFRPGVVVEQRDRAVVLRLGAAGMTLEQPSHVLLRLIETLGCENSTEQQLMQACGPGDALSSARVSLYLSRLDEAGLLQHTVREGATDLAVLVPMHAGARTWPPVLDELSPVALSRHCYVRPDAGRLVVESSLGNHRVVVKDERVAQLLHRLSQPTAFERLRSLPLSDAALRDVLRVLLMCRAVEECQPTSTPSIDEDPLQPWSFADLLFHSRSRAGRHDNAVGKTFPFTGRRVPAPGVKAPMSKEPIALPEVDLATVKANDPSLTAALEKRRSLRAHGTEPISLAQLSEFLYRTARVRGQLRAGSSALHPYDVTSRPYPSGGGAYELELYLIANECRDLERALYHYDPAGHQLHRLPCSSQAMQSMLQSAFHATTGQGLPQVLLVITARHERLSWAYESIAYATTLKNVGALYQTMYLVATAMGLAPCAVGYGNSDLFAEATGLDYYRESAVGEFILGTPRVGAEALPIEEELSAHGQENGS